MILFPVRARFIYDCVKSPVTYKLADKVCYRFMGEGIKTVAKTYDEIGIINIKAIKKAWHILMKGV